MFNFSLVSITAAVSNQATKLVANSGACYDVATGVAAATYDGHKAKAAAQVDSLVAKYAAQATK